MADKPVINAPQSQPGPGSWIKIPGGSAGEGILQWQGPGPAPLLTGPQQVSLRNQLPWSMPSAATTGALPGESIGGAEFSGMTAEQLAWLRESTAAQRLAIQFARQRAQLGTAQGGEIFKLGKTFIRESTPLRLAIIGATERALGLPVSTGAESPVALFGPQAPERQALEAQYGNAREAILETSPARGGQLSQALIDLPQERARAVGAMQAAATERALQLGTQIGFQQPQVGLAAMEGGANLTNAALGGAASNITAAGLGFGSAAAGVNAAQNTLLQAQLGGEGLNLQSQGLANQFQLGMLALQAQQEQAEAQASGAKKGGTGAGVGSAVGGIGIAAAIA